MKIIDKQLRDTIKTELTNACEIQEISTKIVTDQTTPFVANILKSFDETESLINI